MYLPEISQGDLLESLSLTKTELAGSERRGSRAEGRPHIKMVPSKFSRMSEKSNILQGAHIGSTAARLVVLNCKGMCHRPRALTPMLMLMPALRQMSKLKLCG